MTDWPKPRIVWWIDHLGHGGAQKSLVNIVEGVSSAVSQQAIVVLNQVTDSNHLEAFEKIGVEVRIVGKAKLISGIGAFQTKCWLRKRGFDVAVTFLFWSDVIGLYLSHSAGVPRLISSQRSSNANYSAIMRMIAKKSLKLADAIVLNAAGYQKQVSEAYLPNDCKVQIIPNGIYAVGDNEMRMENGLRHRLKIPKDSKIIGTVSRLSPEKGIDYLISALLRLSEKNVQLVLVGSGPEEKKLKKLARELGVEDRVHFLGYCRSVVDIYRSLDVYVQVSEFEGMPMSVLEAMVTECPVAVTHVGGVRDVIATEEEGWIIQARNPTEIAITIDKALESAIERGMRAAKAKQRVLTMFSQENSTRAWSNLLLEY